MDCRIPPRIMCRRPPREPAFSVTGAAPRLPAVAAENTGLLKPHHPAALWQVLLRTPRNCVPKDTVPFEVPHCLRSR